MHKDAQTLFKISNLANKEREIEDSKIQLEMVLNDAEKRANDGHLHLNVQYKINQLTQDRLLELGYTLNKDSSIEHGVFFILIWDFK